MLTKGDEYPIHQTPEPIAFSGTDRNFYDRYFFCGYRPDGGGYFGVGFGVYPHLNVADAHFSVLRDGVQHSVHASRLLNMERMDLVVGPIRIEVIEPLQKLRLLIDSPDGIKADLVMEGRSFPITEPRFTRRIGPRTMMDLTRFTQNVRWSGWVEVDGKRETYEGALGTRDRSWGVRPIGAADAQPTMPPAPQQFYWLWAPTNFPNLSLYYHLNDDADGVAWNTRATLAMDGANAIEPFHLEDTAMKVDWAMGKRYAQSAVLTAKDAHGRSHAVTWTPKATFMMKGIGYGHPDWGHGQWRGENVSAREDFRPDALDPLLPMNLHIQAICDVKHEGGGASSDGVGILEQLVIGPHAPSGFKDLLGGAT